MNWWAYTDGYNPISLQRQAQTSYDCQRDLECQQFANNPMEWIHHLVIESFPELSKNSRTTTGHKLVFDAMTGHLILIALDEYVPIWLLA